MNGGDSVAQNASLVVADNDAFFTTAQDIPFLETGSDGYKPRRKIYNLDNTSTPRGIACPQHAQDVAAFIRRAIDSNIPISVRCGGHDIFGRSAVESALCIDMRAIDFVEVFPDRKSARIGGGILVSRKAN